MINKSPSYYFCLRHFQIIMDLEWEELNWKPWVRRRLIIDLVQEYRSLCKLDNYRASQVYAIIQRKHTKWFDYLLWDIGEQK